MKINKMENKNQINKNQNENWFKQLKNQNRIKLRWKTEQELKYIDVHERRDMERVGKRERGKKWVLREWTQT